MHVKLSSRVYAPVHSVCVNWGVEDGGGGASCADDPGGRVKGGDKMNILNFKKYDILLSINGYSLYNSYFVLESAPDAKKKDLRTLPGIKTIICSLGFVGPNSLYAAATRLW